MLESLEETRTETITVTEAAAITVRDLLAQKNVPDYGLRVFVSGGGCSGMQYGMALEAEARPYDHVIEQDYEDSLMGGGFKIENPNAVSSCGCGSSFKTEGGPAASGGGCAC